jgi:Domain of unknown function DUF29
MLIGDSRSREVDPMTSLRTVPLAELFAEDETAWLDRMSQLVRQRRLTELDLDNLGEYLSDMARRDRREVKSRLVVLIAHRLKWEFQPDRRSRSWQATIITQRQELAELAGAGVLRHHAEAVLVESYDNAVERTVAETALGRGAFPTECPYTVEQLLAADVSTEETA